MEKISNRPRKSETGARQSGRKKKSTTQRDRPEPSANASISKQVRGFVRDLEAADLESYLRLRQALDSLQTVAIHYYASGKNTKQRIERQKEIKKYFDSFLNKILGRRISKLIGESRSCPAGTRECPGGDCVEIGRPCTEPPTT